MTSTTGCGCGCGGSASGGCGCTGQACTGTMERPRYYMRQLVTPADMNLEQAYYRDRMRRHNRLLHGWGVVCGAQVCAIPKPDKTGMETWKVVVKTGYALGPYGDEIVLDCERTVDLRTEGVSGLCGDSSPDPWCSQVFVRKQPQRVFVAIRYCESMTRPVRVMPAGCGCDDLPCEYSRWCDGYEIGVLDACPDKEFGRGGIRPIRHEGGLHEAKPEPPGAPAPAPGGGAAGGGAAAPTTTELETVVKKLQAELEAMAARLRSVEEGGRLSTAGSLHPVCTIDECPPCPTEGWVTLAEVQLDADGTILSIDNCACRRIVISLAGRWCHCTGNRTRVTAVDPGGDLTAGGAGGTLTVSGEAFQPDPQISLGQGITDIKVTNATTTSIAISFQIDRDAQPGPRALTLSFKDCSVVVYPNALAIAAPSQPAEAEGRGAGGRRRRGGPG